MKSQKQTFWKKCMAVCLSVAVIFSGINPAMIANADMAADAEDKVTITVNVAPSTVNATFYEGENAETAVDPSKVTDKGIVDNYHQYELQVEKGRYSYRGVDTLGTEDAADDRFLGGMAFDAPINLEVMEDGSISTEGQVLYLRNTNFYTTNANITKVGDYSVALYPAGLPMAVNGDQYVGTIGTNATERVITPVLAMARGNALTYQGQITLNETLADSYGVANIVNYTIGTGTSVNNKTFALATLIQYTITAEKDAKAQVFNQINNFNVEEVAQTSETDNGDGTVTHVYKIVSGNKTYRVTMKDKITRAGYFGNKAEDIVVTYEDNENPAVTGHALEQANIEKRMEASTMVNINGQNNLKLAAGDTFRLRAYRGAWQIIDTDTANIMIEPDFHYNVISGGEHIEMTPAANKCTGNAGTGEATNWMDIKGVSAGTAIIEVSYDAIQIGGEGTKYDGLYGATDPQRKSLVIINVGETENTLQMKAKGVENLWDTEYDTAYFTGETGTLDFTAALGEAAPDKVELSTDKGASWTAVKETEGVYHAEGLVGGNNILRFTKGDHVEYQVVRAAKVSYTLVNASRDSEEIIEGDEVSIAFKGLYTPVSKFSGIYNPGFGQGHKVTYTTPDTVTVTASGGQYDFITNHTYKIATTTAGTVNLTGGHVSFNVMGVDDPLGGHRILTDAGVGTNFSAVSTMHARGVLPDITFDVIAMPQTPVTIETDAEGTEVTVTDEMGQVVTAEDGVYLLGYGTFKYTAVKEGYVTERGSFSVTKADYQQGKKVISLHMRKIEGAIWDGATVKEPAQVDGVYQIGTGAELAWFAQNAGGTSYQAVLTKDVSLGGFNWTPIAKSSAWRGTFDGQGHYVTDLYIDSTDNNVALFGYVGANAVIKNLGVEGEVKTTGKYAAGIATAKATTIAFSIENCKSEVNVTADITAAGIVANQSSKVTVKNCYNTGDIVVTKDKSSSLTAGGVSCPSGQTQKVVIDNAYNTGRISGVGKHGSVVYLSSASYAGNVKNAYGLVGTCNTKTVAGTDVTKEELKVLAPTLGDAYMANPTSYNEGYPILAWEEGRALAVAKTEFPAELEGYKNAADYRVEEAAMLEEAITAAETAIASAETLAEAEKAVEDAKAAMDQLKTAAEYEAEELAAAKAAAKEEVGGYKNPADYRDVEAAELEAVIEVAKQAIEAAENVNEITAAVEAAKKAMDDIKNADQVAEEEVVTLQQEIAALKSALKAAEAKTAELKSALEKQIGELEEALKAANDTHDADKAALQKEMKELQTELKQMEAEAQEQQKELSAQIADLQEDLAEAKSLTEKQMEAFTAELKSLQDALDAAKDEHATDKAFLESKITALEETLAAEQVEKEALKQQITDLEEALQNAENLSAAERDAMKTEIANLKEALKIAEDLSAADKKAMEAEITALKEALQNAENASAADKAVLNELIVKLQQALKDAQTTNAADKAALNDQIVALEQALENTKSLGAEEKRVMEAEIEALKTMLADAEKENDDEKTALEKEIDQLKAELEKLTAVKQLAAPTKVKASNDAKTGRVQLTWKAVKGADEYVIYRAKAKDAPYKKMITTTGTKYTNITGEAGKTYYYKVKAVSDDKKVENSEFSKVVKRTYDLSRPVVTAKSKTKKQVKLSWKKVDGAKKYVVYRATSKDGKYTKIATTTKTSYTNKKLKSGKTYYYKVKAIAKNSAANSACSVADKCKVK